MNISIESLPKSQIKMMVSISRDDMQIYMQKAKSKISKNLTIPGFRKGEAPIEVIEKYLDQQSVFAEAVDIAVNDSYRQGVQKNNLHVLGQPSIELRDTTDPLNPELIYDAIVSVMPHIEQLPDYRSIANSIERVSEEVSDAEVEEAKMYLLKSRGTQMEVDRPAKEGDIATIGYILTALDKEYDSSEAMPVEIGAGKFIPGFEEQIVGLSRNDKKEFNILFPQEYHRQELAGQEGHFSVEIKKIEEIQLPSWDSDFVSQLTQGKKSLEEIDSDIRDGLQKEKIQNAKTEYTQRLVDSILEQITLELPEILVESEKDRILSEMEQQALYRGTTLAQNLELAQKTPEILREEITPQAESRVKLMIVLKHIAENENIQVSEERLSHEIEHTLNHYSEKERKSIDMARLKLMVEGEMKDTLTLELLASL